jgi:pyruvate formate lyase activating enzyme
VRTVPTGRIFNIQEYAVHDGPGIRTLVFLKGCPLRCRWCCNPEGQRCAADLAHSRTLCRKCRACVSACPHGAVTMGTEGFPAFRRLLCGRCADRSCERECPNKAIRIFGTDVTPAELVGVVSTNALFHRNSGGGVTLSGGEPLAQPAFVIPLLEQCERAGIAAGAETCGAFSWSAWKHDLARFEFIYWDIKTLDAARHRKATGGDNRAILDNLKRTAGLMAPSIILSITVVPGFNDSLDFARKAAALCRMLGISRMRLLPFHSFGRSKYEDLGRRYPASDIRPPDGIFTKTFQATFLSHHPDCVIE